MVKEKVNNSQDNGYDSQEDLENLIRVSNHSKTLSEDNRSISNSCDSLHEIKNIYSSLKFTQPLDHSTIGLIRLFNTLSIIILLLTYFTTSIQKINNDQYFLLVEFLKRDRIQSEYNLMILYIAFSLFHVKYFYNFICS